MKKIILLLIASVKLNAQPVFDSDAKHVYAGILITDITGAFVYHKTKNITVSCLTGILAGVLAGISKEAIYDKRMHMGVCNNNDAYKTFWGTGIGFLTLRVGIDIKQKKDIEKEKFENLTNNIK